jgi:hypothetical protein
MTSLSRTDSLGGGPFTPTMSSKQLNGSLSSNGGGMRMGRTGPQRIDLEPIYTALKQAIGDKMGLYRDSVGAYMMGEFAGSVWLWWSIMAVTCACIIYHSKCWEGC